MVCPNCKAQCSRDSADNGVAVLYGPWGCHCGWSEVPEYNLLTRQSEDEGGYKLDQWGGLTPSAAMVQALEQRP